MEDLLVATWGRRLESLPPFIRTKDFAALLSVSVNYAKIIVAKRAIATVRIGKSVLLPRDAVLEYIAELNAQRTPAAPRVVAKTQLSVPAAKRPHRPRSRRK